jgi:hypothetical protein
MTKKSGPAIRPSESGLKLTSSRSALSGFFLRRSKRLQNTPNMIIEPLSTERFFFAPF